MPQESQPVAPEEPVAAGKPHTTLHDFQGTHRKGIGVNFPDGNTGILVRTRSLRTTRKQEENNQDGSEAHGIRFFQRYFDSLQNDTFARSCDYTGI